MPMSVLGPVLGLLANAMVFGLSWWPFREMQAHGLHPLWATALMYGLSFVTISLWHPNWFRHFNSHPQLWWLFIGYGLTNMGFNWAVTLGDVVRVVLLFYLMPAWSVLVAWWLLGDKPSPGALLRLLLALSGLVIVLHRPDSPWPVPESLADVLALLGGLSSDAAHSLQSWLRRTDLDPQRLQSLDERVGLWMSLARRFKRQPHELAALLQSWRNELKRLELASDLAALEKAQAVAAQAYQTEAKRVSVARGRGAPKLAKAITQAMQGLGMQGGRFEVALEANDQPSASGLESVVFLVAGHAGSTPRTVGKVASGGELSRIALAIAVTTSQLGSAQTLIFDEVDSGVGGAVAETVGRLMQQLGVDRQVLAVTHLPQVAACADHHGVVSKHSDAHGVASSVTLVEDEERVCEIARMLGGEKISDTTLSHAREMLQIHNKTSIAQESGHSGSKVKAHVTATVKIKAKA